MNAKNERLLVYTDYAPFTRLASSMVANATAKTGEYRFKKQM